MSWVHTWTTTSRPLAGANVSVKVMVLCSVTGDSVVQAGVVTVKVGRAWMSSISAVARGTVTIPPCTVPSTTSKVSTNASSTPSSTACTRIVPVVAPAGIVSSVVPATAWW